MGGWVILGHAVLTPSQRFLGSGECLHPSVVHRTVSMQWSPHLGDLRLSLYASTCCPQGNIHHSPWTSCAPFVWNAPFHVPTPTFIHPMTAPHSAFKTAQASHLLCVKPFRAAQSSFLCVRTACAPYRQQSQCPLHLGALVFPFVSQMLREEMGLVHLWTHSAYHIAWHWVDTAKICFD